MMLARSKRKRNASLAEYYRTIQDHGGIGKCSAPDAAPVPTEHEERAAYRALVRSILQHWNFTCWAYGISPVCQKRATDPHELVRRGAGGKVSLENSVASCRACHNQADARVGGNRLTADWDGKADGLPPKANVQGNVRAIWRRTGQ